ncbi:Putative exported protein precursor [Minicystis rosea]|nr:Putative exported protein precursor [Minicystis rosea]
MRERSASLRTMRFALLTSVCATILACNAHPSPDTAAAPASTSTVALSPPAVASSATAAPEPSIPPTPETSAPAKQSPAKPERRCGWVDNPTPANWWLTDRDGTWDIGIQGGYQAKGDLPDFGAKWVETNGHHGYGCACMDVEVDRAAKRVIEVHAVTVLPIERCRKDKALPRR